MSIKKVNAFERDIDDFMDLVSCHLCDHQGLSYPKYASVEWRRKAKRNPALNRKAKRFVNDLARKHGVKRASAWCSVL